MHIYRDIGYLQEFSSGTTWASFGDADIRDDNWQSSGDYYFVLIADDGTDLSHQSPDYYKGVSPP